MMKTKRSLFTLGLMAALATQLLPGAFGADANPAQETVPATDAVTTNTAATATITTTTVTDTNAMNAACPVPDFFMKKIPDSFKEGKLLFNARLRYEHADTTTADHANAVTLRTRFGYQTGKLYNFTGLIEAEDTRVIGRKKNANFPGSDGSPSKTVIADPENTEINRAWIGYERWDSNLKAGRQRIILDNARFVGNVGWRQNEQTFDAVSLENHSIDNLNLYYSWIAEVNRIFGNDSDLAAGQKDFDSDSHLIHATYDRCQFATLGGYIYLLDLENSGAMPSSSTYGLFVDGKYKIDDDWAVNYRGEFAYQEDYADNPVHYDTTYYHLKGGGTYTIFHAGLGYEVLGSDDQVIGFATPLATLHGFNGWADVFLSTPAAGLEDFYVWVGVDAPYDIPVRLFYHDYSAEDGGDDLGSEFDVVASRKFGKHWKLLTKYANYSAGDDPTSPNSTHKFWLQGEFIF